MSNQKTVKTIRQRNGAIEIDAKGEWGNVRVRLRRFPVLHLEQIIMVASQMVTQILDARAGWASPVTTPGKPRHEA